MGMDWQDLIGRKGGVGLVVASGQIPGQHQARVCQVHPSLLLDSFARLLIRLLQGAGYSCELFCPLAHFILFNTPGFLHSVRVRDMMKEMRNNRRFRFLKICRGIVVHFCKNHILLNERHQCSKSLRKLWGIFLHAQASELVNRTLSLGNASEKKDSSMVKCAFFANLNFLQCWDQISNNFSQLSLFELEFYWWQSKD